FAVFDNRMQTIVDEAPGIEFADLLRATLDAWVLRRAAAGFREAIINPDDTGFHTSRGAEFLLAHLQDGNQIHRPAWEPMRGALQISEEWLQWLNHWSKGQRHGRPIGMTGEERIEAIRRARVLIVRFAQYFLGGERPLSPEDFPVLT